MVDDLGDYDIQPVDGNPFGSMASSPNDYDVSPVDHDPFSSAPPTIAGHVAASPDPSQPMTAKYIAARSQESANPYTPPLFDRAGNYVSETAQRYGVPTQGAERMGSATSTGLEAASYAPIVGAPLTAAEGVDAYSRGDTAGAAASGFGTLASFFGPWAKTADLGAMKMAQKMARKGAPAEDIIGKTGWFQGPEGLWRFERPDEGATFTGQGNFSRNLTLGDVYQNPEQYAAYPNLAKSPVEMLDPEYADRMGMLGGFAPTKSPRVGAPGKFLFRHDMPTDSTVPIHETTHAIQDIEGFAPGGSNLNPMQVLSTKSAQPFFNKRLDRSLEPMGYNDYLRDSVNAARAGQKGVPIASRDDVAEMEHFKGLVRAGQEQIPGGAAEEAAWQAGTDWYTHQAGEAEARNAAFRAGNPLIAKAFHPWETSDVPWDEVMLPPYRGSGGRVGFDDGGGADLGTDDDFSVPSFAGETPAPDQFELASRQPEATPSSAGGPPLDPRDRDLLIKTVYGEASGEPALGQAGIAHAILNRVRAGDYGQGVPGVVMAPAAGVNPRLGYHEFSPWNTGRATEGNPTAQHLSPDNPAYGRIGGIVDKAYSGLIPDPTGGATHYYGRMRGHPSWSPPLAAQNQVRIGGTTFVGREHGPGEIASQTASGYAGGGPVQLNGELRRRLAMITQPRHGLADGGDPDAAGFAALDKMVQDDRATQPPDQPAAPAPAAPQTWYGRWGQTLGDELSSVGPAVSAATEGLGKFGASVAANPVGYGPLSFRTMSPESEAALGRDFTGMLDSPMLGEVAGAPRAPEPFAPRVGGVGSDISQGAVGRAQIMEINGVKRHIDSEFPESRVGTSIPKNSDPNAPIDAEQAAHANNDLHVGMDLANQVPSYGKAVADRVRDGRIPYVKVAPGASDAAVQEALIEHMKNNLLGLYNRVSGAVRSGSKLWYEGANARSKGIAQTHDIPHENASGVVAAMSPQKDWDQNVALADWVAHVAGTTADTATMSPEMTDWVNRYALRKDPEQIVTSPSGVQSRINALTGEPMHPASVSQQDVQRQLAQTAGVPWGQMTPSQKAFYTRAYYEAHGPPDHLIATDDQTGSAAHWIDDKGDRKYGYYINNPDGTHNGVLARYGDEFTKAKGQPIPVSWGSTGEVANAIQAFGAKSMSDISEALGDGHKVRSFYNNIIAPWSRKGDVTSDTHAVAAALLRPLGAGSPEAASGMGAAAPGNNETGLKGFYPHVAEAYRRAANEAGVLPRELQSITWEALRGLWSPREKMAKTNLKRGFTSQTDITNGIWQRYQNGQISMQDAHNAILGPQGERIDPPRWFSTFQP